MNRLFIFGFFALFFSVVFYHNLGANCELRTKINRAIRDFSIMEDLKQHKHKALGNPIQNMRSPHKKRDSTDSIPQLAKNIESFLQKVIPNHSLVQDLMGYITMPNPNAHKSRHR